MNIINGYNQKFSYPLLIDLPLEIIKNSLLTVHLENGDPMINESFRFIPDYLRIVCVNKGKKYLVDKNKEFYLIDKKKVSLKRKLIYSEKGKEFLWYGGKRYPVQKILEAYSPTYILDILDENNLSINDTQFYYESLIDNMQITKNFDYNKLVLEWPLLSTDSYNRAKEYLKGDKSFVLSWYNSYLGNFASKRKVIRNFLQAYTQEITPFTDKYNYLINKDTIQSQILISAGDEGNEYINLEKIFKKFPLSLDVPYMSIKVSGSTKIKVESTFNNNNLLGQWSLGDYKDYKDKEINEISLVNPEGLLFKIKNGEEYLTAHLYKDGKFTVRCFKSRNLDNSVLTSCPLAISNIVKFINSSLSDCFIHEPYKIIDNLPKQTFANIDIAFRSALNTEEYNDLCNNNPFVRNYIASDLYHEVKGIVNTITWVCKTIESKPKVSGSRKDQGYFFDDTELYDAFKISIKKHSGYVDGGLLQILGSTSNSRIDRLIYWFNFLLWKSDTDNHITKQVVVTENKNKAIKNKDILFDPRRCQKIKQPTISDTLEPKPGSYPLLYKDSRIICNFDNWKYPGFTVQGDICCFSKDQRSNAKYLKMLHEDSNFSVQPTNILYKNAGNQRNVIYKDNVLYYLEGGKLIELPRHLSKKIMENEIVKNNNGESYFYKSVSFNQITNPPPKSKGIVLDKDNNLVCPTGLIFGYDLESKPYCFNIPPSKTVPLQKNLLSLGHHIITKNKILEQGRLGTLPDFANNIFDKILGEMDNKKELTVYRVGVLQNADSFLSSVAFAIKKDTRSLKNIIDSKLTQTNFLSLGNGDIAPQFSNSLREYKSFLSDTTVYKSYLYYIDIVKIILDVQVIIFSVQDNSIICQARDTPLVLGENIVYVLKNGETYEPIVLSDTNGKIHQFVTTDLIIDLFNYICSPEPKIDVSDVRFQILDTVLRNRVRYLVLRDGFFLPAFHLNIGPLPSVQIRSINKRKQSAETAYKLSQVHNVELAGQILDTSGKVIGLLTSKYIVIPTKPSKVLPDLPISDYSYYKDADKSFSKSFKDDERTKFLTNKKNLEIKYHKYKYMYSKTSTFPNITDKFLESYFQGRLILEMETDPTIKEGTIREVYEEKELKNQIIFTDASQVIKYLSKNDV